MNMIFSRLSQELAAGRDSMLVTVVEKHGSAPRGTGAQMLVGRAGRISGTIGGGSVEKQSEEISIELLKQRKSTLHLFRLQKNDVENIGMVCGGDVAVLFQYVPASSTLWQELVQKILERMAFSGGGWFLQKLDGGPPALLDESSRCLMGRAPSVQGITGTCVVDGHFAMPLLVGERAVIFGGGHIAAALIPLLKSVGFRVTVFDDRAEYADPARFPDAEAVICGDFHNIQAYLTIQENDYVVVMTNGHEHDFEVEKQILGSKTAYIGVIGSKAKTAAVNQRLSACGYGKADLKKIHAPIGTKIKAVTPAEIAVSIAGEMICVRATRREAAGEVPHGCPMH